MNELTIEGKTYISSKRAAEITGYAKDYVGQLCREGRVEARLVGRNWYVLEESIREHRFAKDTAEPSAKDQTELALSESAAYWQQPRYVSETPVQIPDFSHHRAVINRLYEEETKETAERASVLRDMQGAWQQWFARKEEKEPEEETVVPIRREIAVKETTEGTVISNKAEPEESEEVLVPLKRVVDPYAEKPAQGADTFDEEVVEVLGELSIKRGATAGHRDFTAAVPASQTSYFVLKTALVLVALVSASIALIGTGYIAEVLHFKVTSIPGLDYIAGVTSIKSK